MLWPTIVQRSQEALARGALKPIETVEQVVSDAGVEFVVRQASNLMRKDAARMKGSGDALNPFLPYEPEMFVSDISGTHVALLNKFNVIDYHVLIVTRRFVDQEQLLDREDFEALVACLSEVDGLAFYNGGVIAGASQPHKHMQLVPLPLTNNGVPIPMQVLFERLHGKAGMLSVPGLAFDHAFAWIEPDAFAHRETSAMHLHRSYSELLRAVELMPKAGDRQCAPYNLLVTRRWMLLVPRTRERYEGIAVNALGYAGSLFVRELAQLEVLRRVGPMALLAAVGR